MTGVLVLFAKSSFLRNLSGMTGVALISAIATLAVNMHVARTLGPHGFGQVGYAQAFACYFALLTGLCLETLGVRDMALRPQDAPRVVSSIVSLRLVLFFLSFMCMLGAIQLLQDDPTVWRLVLVAGLFMPFLPTGFEWFYMGREQFRPVMISRTIHAAFFGVGALVLIRDSGQVLDYMLVQEGTKLVAFVLLFLPMVRHLRPKNVDLGLCLGYLKSGSLLTLSAFMVAIYVSIDRIMLGHWYPAETVGWYDAASKILLMLLFPSVVFWNVISPRIARKEALGLKTSVWALAGGGGLLALGVLLAREPIITLVYGQAFLPAAGALGILAPALLLNHTSRAFSCPLQLWGKERAFLVIVSGGALANVAINYFLIPIYGMHGAAAATVFSELIVTLGSLPVFLRARTAERT